MRLTIDLGNSFCKVIIFDDNDIVYRDVCKSLSARYLHKLFSSFNITRSMYSAVLKVSPQLQSAFKKYSVREFRHSTKIPVTNLYKTPKTLGRDRLANSIAAAFLFPKENVLVIDAGTCIKYDFINSEGQYLGGNIGPGLNMRFLALNKFTGQLPLVTFSDPKTLIGDSTISAIRTGVYNGMCEEINGVISRYRKEFGKVRVIMTGGDAGSFAGQLNLSIFAASDLVNIGLNEIIKYNYPEK